MPAKGINDHHNYYSKQAWRDAEQLATAAIDLPKTTALPGCWAPRHILIREQKGSPFFSWFPAGELASCWHNRSNLDNNRASRHTKSQRQKRSNYPSEAFSLVIALDQNTASEPPSLEALQYSWDLNWDFVPWVHAIFHETLGIRLVLQASQRRRERET